MSFNNVIGIRTHQWTNQEDHLYNRLLQYFSKEQIFIVVDEIAKSVDLPAHVQKLSLNLAFINEYKLLNYNHYNHSVAWLCGDYFYYVMKANINADFYWLIEPDVSFTFSSISSFFSKFEDIKDDGLVCNFWEINENSDWFKSSHLIHSQAYTCLFPINRLSALAVEKCLVERQRISWLYQENNTVSSFDNKLGINFPNDETIVANTLVKEKLIINDFRKYLPNSFEFLSYATWFVISQQETLLPENQVLHPMRSLEQCVTRVSEKIIRDINDTDCLNSIVVDQDNIKFLALKVGNNISKHISNELNKKLKQKLNMLKLKSILQEEIPKIFSENSKIWEWNNVVVIDYRYKNFTFVLDFKVEENGDVTCLSFERSKQKENWLQLLILACDNAYFSNDRIVLFNSSIYSTNFLETIRKTILTFYKQTELI